MTPEAHTLGPWVILVPVAGALIIGVMARYGSERIRGHGIPEAIEAILINGSRVEPKVALLKPLSSAISIGSGGPFGAEGPIIMTGGAVGSLIAQFFHLTSAERKTLLVAGAAAGMSATFAAPLAAVLLAVELLLFEWKPRSLIPVALASATAAAVRRYIIGLGPLFPVPPHPVVHRAGRACSAACSPGLLAGALSALLTQAVYAAEDALPAPADPLDVVAGDRRARHRRRRLDVSAGARRRLRRHRRAAAGRRRRHASILGVLIVKSIIWSVSLGSGTSGGVLAPLLMMGGALGGVEAWFLPAEGAGFWPLVSMGAILGGTMRSPLTGVVFALELTHDVNMLLPLLVAVDDRARLHRAGAAAIDPDREDRPARLSPEPRVRDRSAGDPVRPRGDAHQRRRASRRRAARHVCGTRCTATRPPARQRLYPVDRRTSAAGRRRDPRRSAGARRRQPWRPGRRAAGGDPQDAADRRLSRTSRCG